VSLCDARPRVVEWVFGVNVLGVIWTARAFAQDLRDGEGARHIGVTCSSASLTAPDGDLTLYQASKIATAGVADALRAEFARYGVGVTSFCPGLLNTMIWDAARARPERFGGPRHQAHETGAVWRAAETPDAAVALALAAVARGGGYAAAPTADDLLERFEARVAAQRAGFPAP
jgi:NAD(P)-dependent dehydrogenase (short-subunit alcohol dehydrogenase family)